MNLLLKSKGIQLFEKEGLFYALDDGLCEPKAVSKWCEQIPDSDLDSLQILVLSCGAGLKCMKDNLPKTRIIPGEYSWSRSKGRTCLSLLRGLFIWRRGMQNDKDNLHSDIISSKKLQQK